MKLNNRLLRGGKLGFFFAFLAAPNDCLLGQTLTQAEFTARRNAVQELRTKQQVKVHEELEYEQVEREDRTHPSQSSILERSVILTGRGHWTFVPKGAVLSLPEQFANRVNLTEGVGPYIPFAEFLRRNRQWVQTYSVTLDQARGSDPISEQVREGFKRNGRVVISVCRGGPISTPPPKEIQAEINN